MLGTIHTYRRPGMNAVDKKRFASRRDGPHGLLRSRATGGDPAGSPILRRETRWEVRVEFDQPLSMSEALEAKNAHPEADAVAGEPVQGP